MWIKYCGFTRREDLSVAADLGIDAAGFIFYEKSKRFVTPEKVREISAGITSVMKVGIFVDKDPSAVNSMAETADLDMIQLFADEAGDNSAYILPVLRVYRIATVGDLKKIPDREHPFLLDAFSRKGLGGTGESFDWSLLSSFHRIKSAIIAGGVTIENAGKLMILSPYGIDISSSIEDVPGIKSHDKMRSLFEIIKSGTGQDN